MTYKELHEKAVRLCEGGTVWVSSHMVRAKRVSDWADACNECEMDSICDHEMCEVCACCDEYEGYGHILYLQPRPALR